MTPAPAYRAASYRIVLLLMALCFISHFNRISMAVAGTERIIGQYGIEPEQMGRVYSAFLVVYTLFMAAGGYFIDRFGVRKALLFVAVGSGVFAAVTGLVGYTLIYANQLLTALFIVRGAMGLFTTPLHPAAAKTISDWIPHEKRTWSNGLVTGAAIFGSAAAPPLFGRLMDQVDWPAAFLIAGSATIILGLVWGKYATDTPNRFYESSPAAAASTSGVNSVSPNGSKGGDWLSLLANPSLLWLTVAYAAVGYFQYLFFYWIQYYFESVIHLGRVQSRWYAAIPVLVMGICMPLGGWVSDRMERRFGRVIGRRIVPMSGMILSAALLVLGLLAKAPGVMVFWFSMSFGALGAAEGPFWLTAVELGGERGGSAAAIVNTGGNGIGLLAPLFTPMISKWLSWQWGIGVGGIVCLAGGLCWCFVRIPRERRLEPETEIQNA